MESCTRCVSGVKEDFEALLSCITFGEEKSNVVRIKEAMNAIIFICNSIKDAKEVLGEMGGLQYLLHFIRSSGSMFLHYGFKTLASALDKSAANQKLLTSKEAFTLIQDTVSRNEFTPSILKSVSYFTSFLLLQNSYGQFLFNETGCLNCYMNLYEQMFPPFMLGHVSVKNGKDESRAVSVEMWQAVNTVICSALNNPVNGTNQTKCAQMIPLALKILQCCSYSEVVSSVCSFFSSLIIDNKQNQNLLVKFDGFAVLKNRLDIGTLSIKSNARSNGVIMAQGLHATVKIVSVIHLAITENESNAALIGKLGIVSSILKLLFENNLDSKSKTIILLALGHSVEACGKNADYLLNEEKLYPFLKAASRNEREDDDLLLASKFIINLLLEQKNAKTGFHGKQTSNGNYCYISSVSSPSCITERCEKQGTAQESESSSEISASYQAERIRLNQVKQERVLQYLEQLQSYSFPRDKQAHNTDHYNKDSVFSGNKGYRNVSNLTHSNWEPYQAKKFQAMTKNFQREQCIVPLPKINISVQSEVPSERISQKSIFLARPFKNSKIHEKRVIPKFTNKDISAIVNRVSGISHISQWPDEPVEKHDKNQYRVRTDICESSGKDQYCSRMTGVNLTKYVSDCGCKCVSRNSKESQTDSGRVTSSTVGAMSHCNGFVKPVGVPLHRRRDVSVQIPTPRIAKDHSPARAEKQPDYRFCSNYSSHNSNVANVIHDKSFYLHANVANSRYGKKSSSVSSYSVDSKAYTLTDYKLLKSTPMMSLKRRSMDTYERISSDRNVKTVPKAGPISPCISERTIDVVNCTNSIEPMAKRLIREISHEGTDRSPDSGCNEISCEEVSSVDEKPEPFFTVLVFPPSKCREHGLINSVEKVWFKPFQDEQ